MFSPRFINKLASRNKVACYKHGDRKYSVKTSSETSSNDPPVEPSDPKHINAWQIHSYGDIKELQLTKARIPFISTSTELLVKVQASSLNPIDLMMMNGYAKNVTAFFRNYHLEFPLTLGRDFCGIVVDKGQDVNNCNVGDHVYGVLPIHRPGSLAEIIISESSLTCVKPKHLSPLEASSLMYAGLTAWSALFLSGELCIRNPKNIRVLVTGASGGVGTLAVQMLVANGATVIATCSADAISLVKALGARVAHDYRDSNYVKNVAKDGPFDIILDCANIGHEKVPPTWQYSKFVTLNSPLVKNTDKYGILGGFAASAGDLFMANIPKCASGKSVRWGFFAPFHTGVEFVDDLVKKRKLYPIIHEIYHFNDLPYAFESLEAGGLRGKIVIEMP